MPSAMPLTTVDAGGGQPAPQRARDLEAVGRGAPRPDDGHRARPARGRRRRARRAGDRPGDEEDGRRVVEIAQARGVRRVVATDGGEPRPRGRRRAARSTSRRSNSARDRRRRARRRAPASSRSSGSASMLAQRAGAGGARSRSRRRAARRARSAQAGAHAGSAVAAALMPPPRRRRRAPGDSPSAAHDVLARDARRWPSRSAIVRATRSARSRPRALRSPRS